MERDMKAKLSVLDKPVPVLYNIFITRMQEAFE